ncbi:major facilitator superfamily domain-containing protein [Chiua virens]|nr:major facilitator superfamily domain-containing protein [Chiua virens]
MNLTTPSLRGNNDFEEIRAFVEGPPPNAEHIALDAIVWKKVDRWILPLCSGFLLLSGINRNNIGNARIAGLQSTLGLSNHQYTVALTVTYIPFMFSELPSVWLLKHVGPNLMLPSMAILWGAVSASQGLVKSYSGLLACRFFVGLFQGGLVSGIILYLSSFYPRKILQTRVTAFFVSANLLLSFSGFLAAAINHLDGTSNKRGWAWIFLIEGLFTVVFGAITFFLLPCSPQKAHFFTEEERVYVISALKCSGSVSEREKEDHFSWTEATGSIRSPLVWLFIALSFFGGTLLYGLAYFTPSIIVGLGFTGNRAQLMSTPPFAATFILSLTASLISDRYQCRGGTAIFFSLLEVIGFAMFYVNKSNYVRYASLFFSVSGAVGVLPVISTWLAVNCAPHTRRATGIAATYIAGQLGGILSTWLLGYLSPAPEYTMATLTFISMSVGSIIISTVALVYLWRENRLKAEMRQVTTKEDEYEGLGDRSAWFVYSL